MADIAIVPSRSRAYTRGRPLLLLSALLAVFAGSCRDTGAPLQPVGGVARLALVPQFGSYVGMVEPISLIRATVSAGGVIIHTQDFSVAPGADAWDLTLEVPLTGVSATQAVVTLVLIHIADDGAEVPQFSGRQTVSLSPGAPPAPTAVTLYQGGPENLEVTGVSIVTGVPTLIEGETAAAQASASGGGGATPQVFWSSANPAIATVSPEGDITAVLPGATTIIAQAGAHSAAFALTVTPRPTSIGFGSAGLVLDALGAVGTLSVEVRDPRGDVIPGAPLTFELATPGVAEHIGGGHFRAIANGLSDIVVSSQQLPAVQAVTTVEVAQIAVRLTVTPPSAQADGLGQTVQFTATGVDANENEVPASGFTWSSSDESKATVDGDGVATAVENGTAVITASRDGASATATFTVQRQARSVEVTPPTVTLEALGATAQLEAEVRDGNGQPMDVPVAWSSSNTGVATVSATGLVTAVSNETVTITATGPGGVRGTAEVTVRQVPVSLELDPATATLTAIGATQTFVPRGEDANGHAVTVGAFTWESSDPSKVTVDQNGVATAVAEGEAIVITARSGSIAGSATVDVDQRAARVVVTPEHALLDARGATQEFTAVAYDARNNLIPDAAPAWRPLNPAVASVNAASGVATALGEGSSGIVAQVDNATGSALLEVRQEAVSLTVTPTEVTADAGTDVQFEARLEDRLGSSIGGRTMAWTSSDTRVATVDASGLAHALSEGITGITVAAEGLSASATLMVEGQGGQAPGIFQDIISHCTYHPIGIAFDGTYYYIAEGGSPNMCIRRYTHDGTFVDQKTFPPDFRGLHYVPATGKLVTRTFNGALWEVDYAAGTAAQITSYNPVPSSPREASQNSPAADPDGETFWVRLGGQVQRRSIADNSILISFQVTDQGTRVESVAVSADEVFVPNGHGVDIYTKAGSFVKSVQLSASTTLWDGFGWGVSLSGDRVMYAIDSFETVRIEPLGGGAFTEFDNVRANDHVEPGARPRRSAAGDDSTKAEERAIPPAKGSQ